MRRPSSARTHDTVTVDLCAVGNTATREPTSPVIGRESVTYRDVDCRCLLRRGRRKRGLTAWSRL